MDNKTLNKKEIAKIVDEVKTMSDGGPAELSAAIGGILLYKALSDYTSGAIASALLDEGN